MLEKNSPFDGTDRMPISVLYAVNIYVSLPAAMVGMVWGWVRWSKRAQRPTLSACAVLSLIGFTLATASSLLAVSSVLYAHAMGGFGYYDPLLMSIYRWGAMLSLSSLAFGLSGVWRPSVLRWHTPLCGIWTFLFWCVVAMSE